jgi:hypothetical protein
MPSRAEQLAAADQCLKHRDWAAAARLLASCDQLDFAWATRLRLARNLACLEQHRPALYRRLMTTAQKGRYQLAAASDGQLTLLDKSIGQSLSVSDDPTAATAAYLNQLDPLMRKDHAIGLCGLGDGHLLQALAQWPAPLSLGRQVSVLVFEPDAELLFSCLMIHDYSGPNGPIEQARVRWYVGDDWADQYQAALLADLYLPAPNTMVAVGDAGKAIHEQVQERIHRLAQHDRDLQGRVEAHYAGLSLDHYRSLLGARPPRRPRVFLTTSRFTTVLQHQTRQVAAAFAALGWDTRLSIEPSDCHRTSKPAFRQHLIEFKPDLIFVIDHLRHEYDPVYPPGVPYVCWIQDDLSNLTDAEQGVKVGPRDFVLTVSPAMYASTYRYPRRQLITMSKLTAPPEAPKPRASAPDVPPDAPPTAPSCRGAEDMVFVSNAGMTPAAILDKLRVEAAGNAPVQRLVEYAGRALMERYQRDRGNGEAVFTLGQMDQHVRRCEKETALRINDAMVRDQIVRKLFHPLNNALYRQQALQWAVAVAQERGLSLGLYGQGWEEHPEFAPFARGSVAYGPDLERLTRAAGISLHVVPYFHQHQRLFDGLAAGGFFLIRHHPSDDWRYRFADFIREHLNAAIRTDAAAREVLREAALAQFEAFIRESSEASLFVDVDHLAAVRDLEEEDALFLLHDELPHRAAVSFTDRATLAAAVDRYLGDGAARQAVVKDQWDFVRERFTFEAGMARVVRRIAHLLDDEAMNGTISQREQAA